MKKKSKSILITGTSSGIGYHAAQTFLENGYRVFGSVRKEEDAQRLEKEFGSRVTPLVFDVCDEEAVQKAVATVERELEDDGLGGLINNAGIAVGGPLLHLSKEVFRKQLEVNVWGQFNVIQAFLPLLGARENHLAAPGRIINISSVSGKLAYPFLVPYAASKHALEALSHGLRRELLVYGIDVVIVGPGAVKTPIWDKGTEMGTYESTRYTKAIKDLKQYFRNVNQNALEPHFIAKKLVRIMEKKRPRARYAFIPGNSLVSWTLPNLLPHRLLDRVLGRVMGLFDARTAEN